MATPNAIFYPQWMNFRKKPRRARLASNTQGKNMEWKIIDSLACPSTGTAFSIATSSKDIKLILWYKDSYFLRPGNIISTQNPEMLINGKPRDLKIIHAFPYDSQLWTSILHKTDCPGNIKAFHQPCANKRGCLLNSAPMV